MHWKKVTLVGVGLLGGSLGLAIRKRLLADTVTGLVRRAASVQECMKAGAVDNATTDLKEAVSWAELIVFCTPLGQMRGLLRDMLPVIRKGTIITDVGSVKGSVVRDLEPMARSVRAHFVGSHPMAGSERTGVGASRADLYANAVCVVTPTQRSHPGAVRKICQLWSTLGGRVLKLSPQAHDLLVSRSSHLPHLLAASLTSVVLGPKASKDQPMLCANGFRDTTRIAASSPEMWRDIVLANRKNVGRAVDDFMCELAAFKKMLQRGKSSEITRFFEEAKRRRDSWVEAMGSGSPE